VIAGAFIAAAGALVIPWATVWWHILPAVILTAVGNALYNPSLTTAISLAAPDGRQGEMLGVAQSASALARVVGMASTGAIFEQLGIGTPFWVAGGVLALVALAVWAAQGRQARDMYR
jgi:DHA1 family tetracycline resistance protein-like MFS transporter